MDRILRCDHLTIERPTLILDRERVVQNIARMSARARAAGVAFRPHFKTHQSAQIGDWFRDYGVTGIAVSSVAMAEYFAAAGWRDITVAIPVNLRELSRIRELAGRIELGLLVESREVVERLATELEAPTRVWIKVDAGYGRAGMRWDNVGQIRELARRIAEASKLDFAGLLAHSGHSYHQLRPGDREATRRAVLGVHQESLTRMRAVRETLLAGGVERCAISVGDTPTCTQAEDFPGVDEIRPGNFLFFDLMQLQLGSCRGAEIAVAVAAPVLSTYPGRRQALLYGGAVHLAAQPLSGVAERPVFGCLAGGDGGLGQPVLSAALSSLSQEHGIAEVPGADLSALGSGDAVLVYPVHSCLTADLYDHYVTLESERVARFQSLPGI